MCDEYEADREPILGLFGNSGGVEAVGAIADGFVGMGGGADLPLASAAGPDATLLSIVGDVDIVLRKGAPPTSGASAVAPAVTVGDAGIELARSK